MINKLSALGRLPTAKPVNATPSVPAQIAALSNTKSDEGVYNLKSFYAGKTLFITGVTGFMGKVLIEKILRCLPEVRKIYALVRPKKDSSMTHRVKKELLESRVFDRLRDQMGKEAFEQYALSKLVPVAGDAQVDGIFIVDKNDAPAAATTNNNKQFEFRTTNELIEELKQEVNVIIHTAATIGFHERLDNAIQLNTYGTLRMIKIAKQCANIQVFCHVSTCYVNSNQPSGSKVEEKQYEHAFPNNESVEDFCKRIVSLPPEEVEKIQGKYLEHFKFPNTYTFTKYMAELLVSKNRQHVPVAILRPSIIGSSLREPVPGWVDAVSAGSAVFFFTGLGISTVMLCNKNVVADNVPVDIVNNSTLAVAAAVAIDGMKNKGNPDIKEPTSVIRTFHCGTSSRHPVTWDLTKRSMVRYWQSHRLKKSFGTPKLMVTPNEMIYRTRFFLSYTLLTRFYKMLAAVTNKKDHIKTAKGLEYCEKKTEYLMHSFRHFTMNEWNFDSTNIDDVYFKLPKDQQRTFFMDVREINWDTYFQYNCWGLQKFVFKENPQPPTQSDIVRAESANIDWFTDVQFAYGATFEFLNNRSKLELKNTVLKSLRVQKIIKEELEKKKLKIGDVEARALDIMDRMFADPKPKVVRVLGWAFRKIWRAMYQSIYVDEDQVAAVREIIQHKDVNGPLILIPTHRSYVDFLILTYVFFAYNLPVPHIAAGEDFLNMFAVRDLFRNSGAFFLRRSFGEDELYKSIFAEYVQQLLADGSSIEFFVEGTRSRAGKTLQPKLGLLSIIADAFLEKKVKNLTILPVNVSYEKVIESEAYSSELLGEPKKGETLENLIAARNVLNNKYGALHVRFGKPISLKRYTEDLVQKANYANQTMDVFNNAQDKRQLVRRLGFQVAHELNQAAVIMPCAMVASIILAYRNGISVDELTVKMLWLRKQIELRGGKVHWDSNADLPDAPSAVVNSALSLLSKQILKRRYMLEPNISTDGKQKDFKTLLQLNCYRNQLVHLFVPEGIVCCALQALLTNSSTKDEGVERSHLIDQCQVLARILEREFVYRANPDVQEDFDKVIDMMINRNSLAVSSSGASNNLITIPQQASELHYFVCSMFWPFIDTYWATIMSLFSVQMMQNQPAETLAHITTADEREMKGVQEASLVQRIQWFTEKMVYDSKILFFESVSIETIKNAVDTFVGWKILNRAYKDVKVVRKGTESKVPTSFIQLVPPYSSIEELTKMAELLSSFRKLPSGNAAPNTRIARQPAISTIMEEIPMLSKM